MIENFTELRVWMPTKNPEKDMPTLVLTNTDALHFFLEAVARGHAMFDKVFSIEGYDGQATKLGTGMYSVRQVAPGLAEIAVEVEEGGMQDFMERSWKEMQEIDTARRNIVKVEDLQRL